LFQAEIESNVPWSLLSASAAASCLDAQGFRGIIMAFTGVLLVYGRQQFFSTYVLVNCKHIWKLTLGLRGQSSSHNATRIDSYSQGMHGRKQYVTLTEKKIFCNRNPAAWFHGLDNQIIAKQAFPLFVSP